MAIKARKPIQTYRELLERVEEWDGVINVSMLTLREIHGAGKLGIHVAQNISDKLNSFGLAHYPLELPQHQDEQVRIYIRGSAVGKLIEAAINVSSPSNTLLREAAANEHADKLERIKELVCG